MSGLIWRRAASDAIRADSGPGRAYWVSRAPLARGMVYTAAHESEGRPAVHLGCYDEADEAKAECERHHELSSVNEATR